jgi:hypothetical protein
VFRDEHFGADLSQHKTYQQIVSEKLGKASIDDVDEDFKKWFSQQNSSGLSGTPVPLSPARSQTRLLSPVCARRNE